MSASTDTASRGSAAAHDDRLRVLVVDDSPLVRSIFRRLVTAEADLSLVGCTASAEEAIDLLAGAEADVILLDLEMPGMGGLDAIPRIIARAAPARILVISTLTVRGAEDTLAALSLGAADTLAKPRPGEFDETYRDMLLRRIRLLGRVARRVRAASGPQQRPALRATKAAPPAILAIGASTGGIHAIGQLLQALPARVDLPILVTQHLPASFSEAFARQLQLASARDSVVASHGMPILPGRIHIAPGDAHLTVTGGDEPPTILLDRTPAASGCCPSVDPMFESCAWTFGGKALGVVLSGMGRDGQQGAARIVEMGGVVIAQDAASSAVWGMPGAVAAAGLASALLPPAQIALRVAATHAAAGRGRA